MTFKPACHDLTLLVVMSALAAPLSAQAPTASAPLATAAVQTIPFPTWTLLTPWPESTDTTLTKYPATYWKEAAIVTGIVSGALLGLLVAGLCADSDVEGGCTWPAVQASIVGAGLGGGIGALIGGLFPKPAVSRRSSRMAE